MPGMQGWGMSYRYPENPTDQQKKQGEEHFRKELQQWMGGSIVGKDAPDPPQWMEGTLLREILLIARKTGRRWREDEIGVLINWLEVDLLVLGVDRELRGALDSVRQAFKLQQDISKNTDIRELEDELAALRNEVVELRNERSSQP